MIPKYSSQNLCAALPVAAALYLGCGLTLAVADQTVSERSMTLISAALRQVNVTVTYDPAYRKLTYPMGDVPRDRGVCTDVIVRAYRDAFGRDLQRQVHEDMRRHFSAYPKHWGLKRPDRNIDHRRVPNLRVFFALHGTRLPVSEAPGDYLPGDLITQTIAGRLPHIGIVTHLRSNDGLRPLIVHNIGAGARLEDTLFEFPITGHYRYGVDGD